MPGGVAASKHPFCGRRVKGTSSSSRQMPLLDVSPSATLRDWT